VAVQLPSFWAERPAVWFAQAEAQFSFAGLSSETTKFFHVISQLDHRYAAEVEDIIISPPKRDPYTTLRSELVRRLTPSRGRRIRQLLTIEEMGDRKPSQFLRHLRSLAPDVPEDFLSTIWSSRLPPLYRPTSPVNRSATWTSQRAALTASPRSLPSRRSPAFHQPPTALHSNKRLRTSFDRWRHSAPSGTASAQASGTLPSAQKPLPQFPRPPHRH
jgi:hypothetical protein